MSDPNAPSAARTSSTPSGSIHIQVPPRRPALSQKDLAVAAAAAQQTLTESQEATVTGATVVKRLGKITQPNTGHPCTSGYELRIKLIGTFPRIVVSGMPRLPGSPTPDDTVRAVIITVDAVSGVPCEIAVQTGDPQPLGGGTAMVLVS
jgi:hypothetical protein